VITRNFRYCTRERIEGVATARKVREFPRKEVVGEKTVEEKAPNHKVQARDVVCGERGGGGERKAESIRMKSGALSETAGDNSKEGVQISGREDKRGETHTP
jgi:hypothetical protein